MGFIRSPVNDSTPSLAADNNLRAAEKFVLWALATLDIAVESNEAGAYRIDVPAAWRDEFDGAVQVEFTFDPAEASDTIQLLTPTSALFDRLVNKLRDLGLAVHAAPAHQPTSVHEITPQLFKAYTVDGGHAQLSGCRLDDSPLLRLTYRDSSGVTSSPQLVHTFFDENGLPLPTELSIALRLDDLIPSKRRSRNLSVSDTQKLIESGKQSPSAHEAGIEGKPIVAAIVWCKHVDGKLSIQIGNESVAIPFAGWAQLLADGREKPPPFACSLSGLASYHLAALDDGRITLAEAIGECEESGRRVLAADLETCDATGKRALPEYLQTCPVTRGRVLASVMITCNMCRQEVSPSAIRSGRCAACRSLAPISKDEPRMARVLGEYPKLDRWRSWRIAETLTAYVLTAGALLRRLLVVVDKETMEVLRLGVGTRFLPNWSDVPESQRSEYLK